MICIRLPYAVHRPALTAPLKSVEEHKTLGISTLSLYHAAGILESEGFVTADTVSLLLPDFEAMSVEEGLAYIARTRRQLERWDNLPGVAEGPLDASEAEAIRALCDELEAMLNAKAQESG